MIAWVRALWCRVVGHRRVYTYDAVRIGRMRVAGRSVLRCGRCGEVLR